MRGKNTKARLRRGRGTESTYHFSILRLLGCGNGANLCAVAAADALVSVDYENVALGNAANRTLRSTCAASDAIFSDFVSHSFYLRKNLFILFYHKIEKNQEYF